MVEVWVPKAVVVIVCLADTRGVISGEYAGTTQLEGIMMTSVPKMCCRLDRERWPTFLRALDGIKAYN